MACTSSKVVLLIAVGIAVYISVLIAQSRAAANLCERYPVGSHIEDLEGLEGTFFLTRMGPINDSNIPGRQKVIYCAALTMCDESCSLEVEDGLVKRAKYSAY